MTDWRLAYNGLSAAGYTDNEIADMANVSRAVVNKVRNGTYQFKHEPGHEGGRKVLDTLKSAVADGSLSADWQEKVNEGQPAQAPVHRL